MKENVQNLKTLMDLLAENEKQLSVMKTEFDSTVEPVLNEIKTIKEKIEAEKKIIEEAAVKEFKETGNKKFVGGIGVQERKTVEYDEKKVFEWALDKKMFLSLDKKSFEKVAENIGAPTVKVDKKLLVTYPKELKIED